MGWVHSELDIYIWVPSRLNLLTLRVVR